MKKVIGLVIGLVPVSAFGECVPVPDCASIGYTETSCEGDSLKCPFDTTKLYCPPCDSSFRYTCTGDNIKTPIGAACNGKYVSCECVAGAKYSNNECICDNSCDVVGNIVYSDKTCSSCYFESKTAVAVVVHKDENKRLIAPLNVPYMRWSSYNADVTTLDNTSTFEIALTDMDGKANTQKIVEFFASDDETNNSAWYCYNLELEGFEEYKHQWYLPAAGEIYTYLYGNIDNINKAFSALGNGNYNKDFRSSSEFTNAIAWGVRSYSGLVPNNCNKGFSLAVSCFLAI